MFLEVACLAIGWFGHKYKEKWIPDVKYIGTRIKNMIK